MLTRLVRWCMLLLGGLVAGAGVCLHGQVVVARAMRDQVEHTFVVWQWIGEATFWFQSDVTQVALWTKQLPEGVLRNSDMAAWTLMGVGAGIVLLTPFLGHRQRRRRR